MRILYLFWVFWLATASYGYATPPAQGGGGTDDGTFEVVHQAPPVTENSDSEWANGMAIGTPSYGGTGCPSGSASSALSMDRKTLSLIFDRYIVEAGSTNGLKANQKNCQMDLPVSVPAGYRVQIVRLDYRGYNLIPARGSTSYSAAYTFNEKKAQKMLTKKVHRSRAFAGPLDENYTLIGRVNGPHWSKCGEDFTLHILTQVTANSNPVMEQTMATVDTLDAVGTDVLKYHLRWKSCQGNGRDK